MTRSCEAKFISIWRSRICLVLPVIIFGAFPARAETLELKSGQRVEGKILKETSDSYLVDAGVDTPLTYFKDEIKAIIPDEKSPALDTHAQAAQQADAVENRAVVAIDKGQMDQGLSLMRQAIALDPAPSRQLNYGSVLFGNGVSLFKHGQISDAKPVLMDARTQLLKAAEGFNKSTDAMFLGQTYFLLGEIERNAFADNEKARTYYQKALSFSDNDGAKAALAQLPG